MNIFVLSENPLKAARMQYDKHVVKMVLESAQMLCGAFDPKDKAPYKRTHYNHPCNVWARASQENYEWLILHGLALATEYSWRYGRTHASEKVIAWCYNNYKQLLKFPKKEKTPYALAMPEKYKTNNAVESYINYYLGEKLSKAKWTRRKKPSIFNPKETLK